MTKHYPPNDDPVVQVKTWLRPSTFRELTGHARRRGMDLALLLSKLADASLHPVEVAPERTVSEPTPTGRKRRRVLTADDWAEAQAMRDAGATLTAIGERFDVSPATVCRNTKGAA